jgi:type II secretory pathway pseudopilin PulG
VSNVLIGIIGVILFIGLALAGALFLGPRFQQSTANSKASAMAQHLSQVASAINLYQLDTGRTMVASEDNVALLTPGYLKSMPRNPVTNEVYRINDANASVGGGPVRMIIVNFGSDDAARDVCTKIEQNAGSSTPDMSPKIDFGATVTTKGRVGCFLYGGNGQYYSYAAV